MNKYLVSAALLAAGMELAGTASATLIVRPGGMVYDTDRNITWLSDANYAATQYAQSGGTLGDADGLMNWTAAATWARNLAYGGYDDGRLPTTTDTGAPGAQCTYNGTDCGFNVNPGTSELAHLFFVELGNLSTYDTFGTFRGGSSGVNWGVVNTGPFTNLQSLSYRTYWSGTEYALGTSLAWLFITSSGYQGDGFKSDAYFAWAVRDGDVAAVPEPATFALMGLGLAGMAYRRKASA